MSFQQYLQSVVAAAVGGALAFGAAWSAGAPVRAAVAAGVLSAGTTLGALHVPPPPGNA